MGLDECIRASSCFILYFVSTYDMCILLNHSVHIIMVCFDNTMSCGMHHVGELEFIIEGPKVG